MTTPTIAMSTGSTIENSTRLWPRCRRDRVAWPSGVVAGRRRAHCCMEGIERHLGGLEHPDDGQIEWAGDHRHPGTESTESTGPLQGEMRGWRGRVISEVRTVRTRTKRGRDAGG